MCVSSALYSKKTITMPKIPSNVFFSSQCFLWNERVFYFSIGWQLIPSFIAVLILMKHENLLFGPKRQKTIRICDFFCWLEAIHISKLKPQWILLFDLLWWNSGIHDQLRLISTFHTETPSWVWINWDWFFKVSQKNLLCIFSFGFFQKIDVKLLLAFTILEFLRTFKFISFMHFDCIIKFCNFATVVRFPFHSNATETPAKHPTSGNFS